MQSEIGLRVRTRVSRDLGEPRAWNHDAARVNETAFECLDCGCVDRVGHAEIVRMNDQQLRVAWITKPFGDRFCRFLTTDLRDRKQRK
jgi:hypothetical protein